MSKQGCCRDHSCSADTCMNLTDATCGDCQHFERCEMLFSVRKDRTTCDFFPRRFRPKETTP